MKLLSHKQFETCQVNADTIAALSRSQALIEFEPDGTIVRANENFLQAMGYALPEIAGKHHRIFLEDAEADSADYAHFWSDLAEGKFNAKTFKRIGKDGREVWIEASYNPLIDKAGKTYRVVKFATDVTKRHEAAADFQRQTEAASASQAVIEFSLDGTILTANQNFCDAMGYRREEIVGKHHRIFVRDSEAQSAEYREFWRRLSSGQYQAAEYLRYGKAGKTVWIQATYNPVFDSDGRPYKVIKYATDVSQRKAAVTELGQSLSQLADGDLSRQIEQSFPPELESIRLAFNTAVARLSDTMRELRTTSTGVRSATEEILSGANDLSTRTMRQSSAISEASASVENLSKAVAQTAEGATAAVDNARTVDEVARNTQGVMEDATAAMGQISADSMTISNIVTLIDDIAFQTNLLALNASVEAARAGDAGKGFAVVAIEVRRLAQSAAVASKDISNVIENSGQTVRRGTELVAAAAERLKEMVRKVAESYELASKIADDNQRQRLTVLDLKKIMGELDEMTQHNAALVEQTNAAIEQTEGQAKRLDELVDVFVFDSKVSTADAAPPRRSAAA